MGVKEEQVSRVDSERAKRPEETSSFGRETICVLKEFGTFFHMLYFFLALIQIGQKSLRLLATTIFGSKQSLTRFSCKKMNDILPSRGHRNGLRFQLENAT